MKNTKPIRDTTVTRVFLIVENRMLREAMAAMFRRRQDFRLLDSARYSPSALQQVVDSECDILVANQASALLFPDNFISDLLSLSSDRKAILFGMDDDPEIFLQSVRSGVSGYLLTDASAKEVLSAVRKVASGEAVSPPRLCHHLFQCIARTTRQSSMVLNQRLCLRLGLTSRQQQLMGFLARGLTNKEIGETMHISEFTVKRHLHRIMRRLNAQSRYAAVQTVCENNLATTV
jgi:DNA-binding NarL/FixJ family response regulator